MKHPSVVALVCALAVALHAAVAVAADAAPATFPSLPVYESRYYVIHSDLPREHVREAELRMTKMADEYRARTRGFPGQVRGKLPFYLFATDADYVAAGGLPGTAGMYHDKPFRRLMAVADEGPGPRLWNTVQHEGFHQYVDAVTRAELPMWVHEALAEYFGEMLFTGDGFVAGVVPQWRLERIRATLALGPTDGGYLPLAELMRLSHGEWNDAIRIENYDQVWSLAHFLVHADRGRYRAAFDAFLRAAARGQAPDKAWAAHLGEVGLASADALERKWRAYWSSLPDHPTDSLYAEAAARALASLLARATARGQRFDDFDGLLRAAEAGQIKMSEADWLPPSVGQMAGGLVEDLERRGATFALGDARSRQPRVVVRLADRTTVVGRFTLRGERVADVTVERGR